MPEPSNKSKPEIEASYYDKYGVEIKNFDILKVFHFTGVNNQGRGRKHYYVYKWVMLVESNGKLYWAALHLDSDKLNRHYWLKAVSNTDRIIYNSEVIQTNEPILHH